MRNHTRLLLYHYHVNEWVKWTSVGDSVANVIGFARLFTYGISDEGVRQKKRGVPQ